MVGKLANPKVNPESLGSSEKGLVDKNTLFYLGSSDFVLSPNLIWLSPFLIPQSVRYRQVLRIEHPKDPRPENWSQEPSRQSLELF